MSKRKINREEVWERVLKAAEEEFGLNGYKATSIQSIAERAGLPKANVVYYFTTKENLYRKVLNRIARDWNNLFTQATVEDDPAQVLDHFIRAKLLQSLTMPKTSRIFAMEVLQGAPHLKEYLEEELYPWLMDRTALIRDWIKAGKMTDVDPQNLIFMIWATTQHYADFEAQILALSNRESYDQDDIKRIGDTVSGIILRGCGLAPPEQNALM